MKGMRNMKKLAVCLLIGALAVGAGACGKAAPTGSDVPAVEETGTEDMEQPTEDESGTDSGDGAGERTDVTSGAQETEDGTGQKTDSSPQEEEGDSAKDNGIWQQCLDMDESAELSGYPEVSINGTKISTDWTVGDFIENGLIRDGMTVEVRTVAEEDGSHNYSTVTPPVDDIAGGMAGIGVFVCGDDFTASFSLPDTTYDNEVGMLAKDMKLSTLTANNNFDCQGIQIGATRTEVAETFGPTHWDGRNLMYTCSPGAQGYISFEFPDSGLNSMFINVGN